MVDEVDGPIALLEYTSPNKESFTAFNKERDGGVQEGDVDVRCDEPKSGPTTEPNSTGTRNDVGSNDVATGTSNPVGPNDIVGTAAIVVAPSRGRGRLRKETSASEEPTRGRGMPRNDSSTSKVAGTPVRGRGRPRQATSTSKEGEAPARGGERSRQAKSTSEEVEAPARDRGRPAKYFSTSEAAEVPARGRGRQPKDSNATEVAKASSRGEDHQFHLLHMLTNHTWRGKEHPPYKRPKTVGMRVFVAENGFTTYNHGLPSSRILHSGARQPIRSAEATGDLGFKPRTGVRWKGKTTIRTGQLEEMRLNKRKKSSSAQSRKP
ncbi:hypothetical protein HAX54_050017 [Datura stramonium]|uniref:Uncharacterized protein n=1 Tax=Datura stramonium TaxID=4076 RepID=A0ABS8SW40_DATST|nr:hypothetical protein [Datura stramonium]